MSDAENGILRSVGIFCFLFLLYALRFFLIRPPPARPGRSVLLVLGQEPEPELRRAPADGGVHHGPVHLDRWGQRILRAYRRPVVHAGQSHLPVRHGQETERGGCGPALGGPVRLQSHPALLGRMHHPDPGHPVAVVLDDRSLRVYAGGYRRRQGRVVCGRHRPRTGALEQVHHGPDGPVHARLPTLFFSRTGTGSSGKSRTWQPCWGRSSSLPSSSGTCSIDWASVAFQLAQGFSPVGKPAVSKLLEYVGGQIGVVTPLLFLAFVYYSLWGWVFREKREGS